MHSYSGMYIQCIEKPSGLAAACGTKDTPTSAIEWGPTENSGWGQALLTRLRSKASTRGISGSFGSTGRKARQLI